MNLKPKQKSTSNEDLFYPGFNNLNNDIDLCKLSPDLKDYIKNEKINVVLKCINNPEIEIYNMFDFIVTLSDELDKNVDIDYVQIDGIIEKEKKKWLIKVKGCDSQCPSCQAFCKKNFAHITSDNMDKHDCHHQYLSMGGNVWFNNNLEPVLVTCTSNLLKDTDKMISNSSNS